MIDSQTLHDRLALRESDESSAQRGLHKSVNVCREDVWHSVWKRIESAGAGMAIPVKRHDLSLLAPQDYVIDGEG